MLLHEEDEEKKSKQKDVGDLRVADARQWQWRMHADIGATAEQVAIVEHQDERRDTDALAELLQHESSLRG